MKIKKNKPAAFVLAGCIFCTTAFAGTAIAAPKGIQVQINGITQHYDQQPVSIKGSVMVPMRAIFESLGATLKYNNATSTVTANKGTTAIELQIKNINAKINGRNVRLNAAPVLINGKTMVPIRFIGEALGSDVKWDSARQMITIKSDSSSPRPGTSQPGTSTETTQASSLNNNGNANSEGIVAEDSEWIYYVGSEGSQLFKSKKDRSQTVKLAAAVTPRFLTLTEDWIYFVNVDGAGTQVYKIRKDGKDLTKVTEQNVWYMAKSGSWLIFNMLGDNGGLFRLNPNGGKPERVTGDQVGVVNADDHWIYYNNGSDGDTFYKVRADGSGKTKLNDTNMSRVQSVGDTVYYTDVFSTELYTMKNDGTNNEVVSSNVGPFIVQGSWVYFVGMHDNRSLYKMKTDGSGLQKLSGNSADNVMSAGQWIFYQNGSDSSQMYTIGFDGKADQPAYLFTQNESDLNQVVAENFEQERQDALKRSNQMAKEKQIVQQREGKMAEQVADAIVGQLTDSSMSDLEKVKVFHDYLVRNVQYDYDNYMRGTVPSESYTPYGSLVKGIAVCDGYSRAMEMLLTKAGIENVHVIGSANGYNGRKAHSWNLVKVDGKYYHVDATFDDPALSTSPFINYGYFLRTDEDMAIGHEWDRAQYPQATSYRFESLEQALTYAVSEGDWYYYSDMKNGNHIYKINLHTLETAEVLAENATPRLISGGWLYYTSEEDGSNLYRMKLDGSERHKLANQYAQSVYRIGDWFVFQSSFSIYKVHKDGGKPVKLSDDTAQQIVVTDQYIYYNTAFAENGHIYRINPDGSGKLQIDQEKSIRNFRIDGDWIYFSTLFPEKNGRMRLDGSAKQYIQ